MDHTAIQRWGYEFIPLIEQTFRTRKKQVSSSWRMGEIYIKVKEEVMYLYRAVNKDGSIFDFLLAKR